MNELYHICQKAAEGASVPAGLDNDLAQGSVWLVAREFAVLDALCNELTHLNGRTDCCFSKAEIQCETIALAHRPGALLAAPLVDLLLARASDSSDSSFGQLKVDGLSTPLYLAPAAVAYAREGWHFRFALENAQAGPYSLVVEPDGVCLHAAADTAISPLLDGSGFTLSAYCTREPGLLPAASPHPVLMSREVFHSRAVHSQAQGVEVSRIAWERLQALARKTLVPATAQSRERGAG
ncbi:MAG: hypothetical protein R3F53_23430 [Gammaproteobacteria bacterium]